MNIQKPLSILRADFINSIIELVNNSNLPPFIIEPILKDVLIEVDKQAKIQLEKDIKEYNSNLDKHIEENEINNTK